MRTAGKKLFLIRTKCIKCIETKILYSVNEFLWYLHYAKCASSNGPLISSDSIKTGPSYDVSSDVHVNDQKVVSYCDTTQLLNVIFIDEFDWSTTVSVC